MHRRRTAPRDRKRHGHIAHWLVGISASLALVIAAGSAYGFVAYKQAGNRSTRSPTHCRPAPRHRLELRFPTIACAEDICNYLLLGSDSRAGLTAEEREQFGNDQQIGGENRADTIMLVHTDPALEKAIILSFPRDLWVNIPGKGYDKINASFEGGVDGGGPKKVAETVQALTGLQIDHVLYVDLAGFQGVVETLGGVDMCITAENVNTPGYVEGEGESHLLRGAGLHRRSADRTPREARVSDAPRRPSIGIRANPASQV